jgi:6-phosphogluconolactonase
MKRILILLALLPLFTACNSSSTKEMTIPSPIYSFLVGTYTDSTNHGINLLKFNPGNNSLTVETIFEGINNPSFLLANRAENLVISLEEGTSINGGNLMVFGLAGEKLNPIDTIPSYGDHPCYIGFSPNEQFVVAANYSGGSLSIYKLNPTNQLSHLQTIQHHGKSINESRQEKAHVHSAVFSPDGNFLLVADLGTDKIYSYAFKQSGHEPVTLYSIFEAQPGDGPRHILFSSDGKTVFAVQELTAILEIFDFEAGKLTPRQRLSLLADDFKGAVGGAELRISPDGKQVYVSNRGEANSISVFRQMETSQDFERIQVIASGGIMPRNFNLTADGKYLICAHQASNDIVIFERASDSGILTATDLKVAVTKPVYLFPLRN